MSDKSAVWVVVAVIAGVLLLCLLGGAAVFLFGFSVSQQPVIVEPSATVTQGTPMPVADLSALAATYDDVETFEDALSGVAEGLSGGRFVVAYVPAGGEVELLRNDGFGPHELAWLDGVIEDVPGGQDGASITAPSAADMNTQVMSVRVGGAVYAVVIGSRPE